MDVELKRQSSDYPVEISACINELSIPSFVTDSSHNIISTNVSFIEFIGYSGNLTSGFNNICEIESIIGANLDPENINKITTESSKEYKICFSNLRGEIKSCYPEIVEIRSETDTCYWYLLHDLTASQSLHEKHNRLKQELSIFSQVASVLGSSLSTEEILKTILIAVTAKEGLGFNRAFLFLYDKETACLRGHIAVGPSNPEEAGKIWGSLPDHNQSLEEVLYLYSNTFWSEDNPLNRELKNIIICEHDNTSVTNTIFKKNEATVIKGNDCLCSEHHDSCLFNNVAEFAAVPLVSGNNLMGLITADNKITANPISKNCLEQLKVFADHAAVAIERTRLYDKLATNFKELEKANKNLINLQNELVKLEKVSLWSELTYDIAHELRNPASIIGGFAALINKSKNLPFNLNEQAGIIFSECQRLEKSLDDLLDFSRSFTQEKAVFNLYDSIKEVVDIHDTKNSGIEFHLQTDCIDSDMCIYGRSDQVKYAVYTIVSVLDERLPENTGINLHFESADKDISVHFDISGSGDEITKFISDFANPRAGKLGLKLSMAFEAIKFNQGEMGIANIDENTHSIYLSFPILRGQDANNSHC